MIARSFELCRVLMCLLAMGCGSVEVTIFALPGAEGEVAALVVDVTQPPPSGGCDTMELEVRAGGVLLAPEGTEQTCLELPASCQRTLVASQGVFPHGSQVLVVLRRKKSLYTGDAGMPVPCSGKALADVVWSHPGVPADAASGGVDSAGPDATGPDASAPDAGTSDADVRDAESDAS